MLPDKQKVGSLKLHKGSIAPLPTGGRTNKNKYLAYDGWWTDNVFQGLPKPKESLFKDKNKKEDLRWKENKITYGNGDVYEGTIEKGNRHGRGKLV